MRHSDEHVMTTSILNINSRAACQVLGFFVLFFHAQIFRFQRRKDENTNQFGRGNYHHFDRFEQVKMWHWTMHKDHITSIHLLYVVVISAVSIFGFRTKWKALQFYLFAIKSAYRLILYRNALLALHDQRSSCARPCAFCVLWLHFVMHLEFISNKVIVGPVVIFWYRRAHTFADGAQADAAKDCWLCALCYANVNQKENNNNKKTPRIVAIVCANERNKSDHATHRRKNIKKNNKKRKNKTVSRLFDRDCIVQCAPDTKNLL